MGECEDTKPKAGQKPKPGSSKVPQEPLVEFPHFLRVIGPKQIRIAMFYIPSAICYTISSLILATYTCEWKDVLQYMPYYNGKYQPKETETEKKSDGPQICEYISTED